MTTISSSTHLSPAGVTTDSLYSLRYSRIKPSTVDLAALQNASRVVHEQFAKDAQIVPELDDILRTPGGQASASYSVCIDDVRAPYQKRKFLKLPDGLFKNLEKSNLTSQMGLLPEIERAWISVDNRLFLWEYLDENELSSFEDQNNTITHVAVVKPKSDIFIGDISHLLVICTPFTILLLGLRVYFSTGKDLGLYKKIELYETNFTIPCEVEMTSVTGTRNGRIFMCGAQDGNLYELHYQGNESWFSKPAQIINHSVGGMQSLLPRFTSSTNDDRIVSVVSDKHSDYFYTLSITNTISVYKLKGEKHVQLIQTLSNIYQAAQDKAPGSPALTPQAFQITNLHVMSEAISHAACVQLMAITANGVRLYFAPASSFYSFGAAFTTQSTQQLQLIHVRLPPANLLHPDEQTKPFRAPISAFTVSQPSVQPSTRPYIVSSLETSCYSEGLLVAAQPGDTENSDYLLCLAPDLSNIGLLGQVNHPIPSQSGQPLNSSNRLSTYNIASGKSQAPLVENATLLSIPGRTWAITSIPSTPAGISPGLPAPAQINELAKQFEEPSRQFVILTSSGVTFLKKRRVMDYLKAVLEELESEGNVQPIIEFRDSFGRDQTCAMLLGLASGNTFLDTQEGTPVGNMCVINPDLAAVAKQAFFDFGERPTWTERVTYGSTDNQGTTVYSGRREGLAIFFARMIRSLWKCNITRKNDHGLPELGISDIALVTIQKNLWAVRMFIDSNPYLFHSPPSDGPTGRLTTTEQEAWKAEHNSVTELRSLLTRTIEAFSFLILIFDFQFSSVVSKCDAEAQQLISSLTFEDLVTSQKGIIASRALVNVIIDRQIGQQFSIDGITEHLQDRCGSFCSTDDVLIYKAKEIVRKAIETKNPMEKQNCLAEALRLFVKGARILEFEKLRELCGDFQQLNYAKGAILLPLTCAQVADPNNIGVEAWHAGIVPGDPLQELVQARLNCYQLVMDSLLYFEEACKSNLTSASNVTTMDDSENVRSHAYELAFESEDEMFHSTLYDWLISRQLADDLLDMRPAFLEAHLRKEPVTVDKYQLLWQFYVKNGQPLRAAEVLSALAESDQFDLHIDSRLEHLTLAVANAKSHPISEGGRHETAIAFLTNLEEKLDVAQVQLQIYLTLLPHMDDAPEVGEKIRLLSKKLFTMTELYQGYAVAFDLPIMKLLCLHVSEHRDESVVRPVWNQIFDDIMSEGGDAASQADLMRSRIGPLGLRFYPSECAFPLRFITTLIIRFELANKDVVPSGWVARLLVQCGVPFLEIWEVLHEMYESQVPPFNDQANVQTISSEISILLSDWLDEATKPQSSTGRSEFPVGRIDIAIDQYLSELEPSRTSTKTMYENVKRQLRRYW